MPLCRSMGIGWVTYQYELCKLSIYKNMPLKKRDHLYPANRGFVTGTKIARYIFKSVPTALREMVNMD